MKLPWSSHSKKSPQPTGYVGDHADTLGHVRKLPHEEDERPTREDKDYGQTIFTRPHIGLVPGRRGGKKKKGDG
jgi:hypothetical protein